MEALGLLGFLPCECQTVREVVILGLFGDEVLISFETSGKVTSKPRNNNRDGLKI
jgi:hypothetical protein